MRCKSLLFAAVIVWVLLSRASAEPPVATDGPHEAVVPADTRWWPLQRMPKALVRLEHSSSPERRASYEMTTQSVAGLAAKSVNEERGDEMVWIAGGVDVEDALERRLAKNTEVQTRGTFTLWELVDRYAKKGIIKGYILYRADKSNRHLSEYRPDMDLSVNVATSLAGLLDGIIVDESIEGEAKARGLKLLMDARDKSQAWCFDTYRDEFTRRMVCTQDPKKAHVRDMAIAQKAITVFGNEQPTPAIMKWLEPLSPVLGWNGGDEFQTTDLSSRWGHFQTATDWCLNLPPLMAGTEKASQDQVPDFDPRSIDWKDRRSAVSFISSDGDNVQWYQGNFLRNESYWGDKNRGTFPFGWSCCFTQLAQLCPEAITYSLETRTAKDSFIEWGGGYYYPDRFALDRPDRWKLLAEHARRTWALMKRNNTRIIGFNVARFDSPDARKAYEVFARQTDGLLGILVFQYAPYEGGAGKTFWVKDRNGIELPVITARYSIWANETRRDRAGTPAKVAREIRETVKTAHGNDTQCYDWVICHAWSFFRSAPGDDEDAENMRQDRSAARGGLRGYSPAVWCAERLPEDIRVVAPEELVWRVRMARNSAQTTKFMRQFP